VKFENCKKMLKLKQNTLLCNGGANIHYVEAGPVDGLPVMLVHGWPDTHFGWRHQIEFLANRRCRVFALDLRGFGQSKAPSQVKHKKMVTEEFSLQELAKDCLIILSDFGIKKAVFMGHDWGGAGTNSYNDCFGIYHLQFKLVVWEIAMRHARNVIAIVGVCTPYTPYRDTFLPLEQLCEVLPRFYYQSYFAREQGAVAAAELSQNVERTLSCLLRAPYEARKLKTHWMRSKDDCVTIFISKILSGQLNNVLLTF
jgi:soluble epoxide hydrolase/lipid-phosphate phosphatase